MFSVGLERGGKEISFAHVGGGHVSYVGGETKNQRLEVLKQNLMRKVDVSGAEMKCCGVEILSTNMQFYLGVGESMM